MSLLKLIGIFSLLFVIFVMSGIIANAVLIWSGSVWTSSISFSMSFVGLMGVFVSGINFLLWLLELI